LDGCSDDSNGAVIPKTLSDYLRERLPVYMIPAAMIPLDRLPLNANGKVDRKALPAPEFTTSERFEPPEGDTEIQLAAIWQEVLATSDISLGDDFFLLGGHSLHLVRIQVRIRAAFDCDIPLADLFRAPVLRDMAARVERALGRNDDDDMNFMAELLETL
jgi:acyl carrier protein